MIIYKITPSVDYSNQLKRLGTELNELTNKKFNKSKPKLLNQQIRKCYYKTLGTSVINSPMSPPFLDRKQF